MSYLQVEKLPLEMIEEISQHSKFCNNLIECKLKGSESEIARAAGQFKISFERVIKKISSDFKVELYIRVKSPESSRLVHYVNYLWKIARDRLLTTPVEMLSRVEYLGDIFKRAKRSHNLTVTLEREIKEQTAEKDKAIALQDCYLRLLMSKLEKCHQDAYHNRDQIIAKSSNRMSVRFKKFEVNSRSLRDERMILQTEVKLSTKDHFAFETEERKKCFKLKTELQGCLSRYDETVGAIQEEIDEQLKEQATEKSYLAEVESRVAKLKVDYERIMEERREREAQRKQAVLEMRGQMRAALFIQALWRGVKTRRRLRKKKGKKKGKRKGKKKR
eukprot:Seg6371.1 transcript_id=Seg6371.1/GoldUCD/mRNA.D3Y31 product="Dynein regulatory complex protein 10" protein_id=Seg6371.1/GoldUCD/D3Y31